jgi:glycosyltransferase involved in cell wall biosynthesis
VRKADQKLRFALLFPYLAARKASSLLATTEYDLLYGYEVHGLLAQGIVRRRVGLPLVARYQGTVMQPYLDRPWSLARKLEETVALKMAAELYIMTNDGTQGDEVLARLNPRSAGKVRFWRNGLDLGSVRTPTQDEASRARRELSLAPDELVLVTSSRLARWKRIDRAIDAVAVLRELYGIQARLLIVGDGEERTNLKQQVDALHLGDQVRLAGAVPQQDVTRYLWAADVFLSVNELSNVGNPLLEAMLAGRCILTLDEGDPRELIRNDDTGVLLSTGDPRAIAEALATLAREPELRARLAASAREFAQSNFWSWRDRIDAEVDAIEQIALARRGQVPVDAPV